MRKMIGTSTIKTALILFTLAVSGYSVLSAGLSPQAIAKDDGQASLILAQHYIVGTHVARNSANYAKGVALLNDAADKGNVEAISVLGSIYYQGNIAPKNIEKAYKLINFAASKGDTPAITNLAKMYRNGEGVQKNLNKAITLLMEATALGNEHAFSILGCMYGHGEISASDHTKAVELFEKTQSPNEILTMYHLGIFYANSDDYHQAASWFTKAANVKSTSIASVCSSYYLGKYYAAGKGVEKNSNMANALLIASADNIINYYLKSLIPDSNIDKINNIDLSNAFSQYVSHKTTSQYSKTINDTAVKMENEIAKLCPYA